ncbi:MAG: ribonuclease P protein component [Clostridia bacterium]|nr:ribonuclease P protein component [Clostridia bacterium]
MLKRENRLTKRKEFNYVYRKGSKLNFGQITIYSIKSKFAFPRFGISVNNKVGNAVLRNKIKRRLRSILCEYVEKIMHKNIIVVAHNEVIDLDYQSLKQLVYKAFSKGKIINEINS